MTDTPSTTEQTITKPQDLREGKYLTFALAAENYGIPVLKVKEILGMMPINTVPQMPAAIEGIINLRDQVIPILNMRTHFKIPKATNNDSTCIIVVEGQHSGLSPCWEVKECGKPECPAYGSSDHRCWMISGTFCRNEIQGTFHEKINACRKCNYYQSMQTQKAMFLMGIIVDAVQEVSIIKEEEVEDPPAMSTNAALNFILGIAKKEGSVKILLDIDKVLNSVTK